MVVLYGLLAIVSIVMIFIGDGLFLKSLYTALLIMSLILAGYFFRRNKGTTH